MISDLPLPVSPVSRFRPGPNLTLDSATRARSRTFSSLSNLLLGNQGPAPTQLVCEPQVSCLARMVHDNLVQADLVHHPLPLASQRDLQHRPRFDPVLAVHVAAEAGLHLFGFDLGQEAEVPMVDAEDRDVARSRHARAGKESSVAAQRQEKVGFPHDLGHHLSLRLPLQLDGFDLPRLHRMKDAVDLVLLDTRTPNEADLHNAGLRWTNISRLPSAPVTSDGASPATVYRLAPHHSRKLSSAASIADPSLTMPPFPTWERPTWNCGLKRATTSASGAARRTAGSTFSRPMKETSITTSNPGSGSESRWRAW